MDKQDSLFYNSLAQLIPLVELQLDKLEIWTLLFKNTLKRHLAETKSYPLQII